MVEHSPEKEGAERESQEEGLTKDVVYVPFRQPAFAGIPLQGGHDLLDVVEPVFPDFQAWNNSTFRVIVQGTDRNTQGFRSLGRLYKPMKSDFPDFRFPRFQLRFFWESGRFVPLQKSIQCHIRRITGKIRLFQIRDRRQPASLFPPYSLRFTHPKPDEQNLQSYSDCRLGCFRFTILHAGIRKFMLVQSTIILHRCARIAKLLDETPWKKSALRCRICRNYSTHCILSANTACCSIKLSQKIYAIRRSIRLLLHTRCGQKS